MYKLLLLDNYLRKERTGNSVDLARKVGVSRSSLFILFNELRVLGALVIYDIKSKTYRYSNDFKISVKIEMLNKRLHLSDMKELVDSVDSL